MPMDIIPKALYPVVPMAPGVPAMLRSAAAIADTATLGLLGIGDALGGLLGDTKPMWGVFDKKGKPIAIADTVLAIEYRAASRISDHPQEQGAFASYNKVATPYQARIILACGSDYGNRVRFLDALEKAAKSLDLYTIITPEANYLNANLEAFDYRRTSESGAEMIVAELHIREIRQTAAAKPIPKSDSAQQPVSGGSAWPQGVPTGSYSIGSDGVSWPQGQATGSYRILTK